MPAFDPQEISLPQRLRALQIITFALALGAALFGAIALYLVQPRQMAPIPQMDILVYLAAGFMALQFLLFVLWPRLTLPRALRSIAAGTWQAHVSRAGPVAAPAQPSGSVLGDVGKLLSVLQALHIQRLAFIEGATFFNGIAFLVTGEWLSFGLLAAGVLLIVAQFPTAGRTRRWLEDRLQEVDLLRSRGDFPADQAASR